MGIWEKIMVSPVATVSHTAPILLMQPHLFHVNENSWLFSGLKQFYMPNSKDLSGSFLGDMAETNSSPLSGPTPAVWCFKAMVTRGRI